VTTRERARCGHENESSQEEERDGILIERMFESSNKASLGMIECSSMLIEEEEGNGNGMVIESIERSEKSECVREMEIESQSDGRGLHPSGGEASSDLMAYGYGTGSQGNGPGVNDLVSHPVTSCPHNMDGDERRVGERYGDDESRRCLSTPQERPSYSGELERMPRAIRLNLDVEDVKMGGCPPHPVGPMGGPLSSEGDTGVYSLAAGGNIDGLMGQSSDLPSILGAREEPEKGRTGEVVDCHIGRVGHEGERGTEWSECEARRS
jgi:hypothetical protein